MTSKQRVLILGATGRTGKSILDALVAEPASFEVEALVRPSSADKPDVKGLASHGVSKIHVIDISGPIDELVRVMKGVDVFISGIDATSQRAQLQLVQAAKQAGVKRFIPCAFITIASPGGVMALRDSKEEVYQEIWRQFLPYTIIDVGFWHQISFPTLPSGRVDYAILNPPSINIHAGGTAPNMLVDLRDLGRLVARIIKDPRTLNHFVAAYGDVLSQNEIFSVMEEVSGEKIVERKHISADEIVSERFEAAAKAKAEPDNWFAQARQLLADYNYSKYVRGDNTPTYAKYLGYLDTRELYPDFMPISFKEFAKELLEGGIESPSERYRERLAQLQSGK
ncbi:Glycoside hydrolase [Mycena sanguinolenta]|uniref:Glycoside hydrolase n=1 Tax=Mycena sanguinolenta TaxID=230812 RepID=A0A8H7DA59_9AGAR|nr:Glycoside hydrolase [Mycena sanguinolenta]